MRKVLILPDSMKGHLIPIFQMAENLREAGYQVCYLGMSGPIEEARAKGYQGWDLSTDISSEASGHSGPLDPISLILDSSLDELIHSLDPLVIIAPAHNALEALAFYYKYQIRTVLFWTHFPKGAESIHPLESPYTKTAKALALERVKNTSPALINAFLSTLQSSGISIGALSDFVAPIDKFSHFVACPKEFLQNEIPQRTDVVYLGMDMQSSHRSATVDQKGKNKITADQDVFLIYASLGSWPGGINANRAYHVFNQLLQLMRLSCMHDCKLIIAAGRLSERLLALDIPVNVEVNKWVDQLSVLDRADLAIIHGGMGAVKECIEKEVPMIVTPLGLDQFDNAKRVAHHQLGVTLEADGVTSETFARSTMVLRKIPIYKVKLQEMKGLFEKTKALKHEVRFLNRCLEFAPANNLISD